VFAAASLTAAFNDAKLPEVTFQFGPSSGLATQLINGASADVFASADAAQMQRVVDAGLATGPVVFARNVLTLVVAPGNPKHITSIADLNQAAGGANADHHIKVGLAAPGVPVRTYADQMFAKANEKVAPDATGPDVVSTLNLVAKSGEADVAVVYVTDAFSAGALVAPIKIPAANNVIATYPIVALKHAPHPIAARAFVRAALRGAIRRALAARRFATA